MTLSLPCPCWTGNCVNCRPELHTRLVDGTVIDNESRANMDPAERVPAAKPDKHGNVIAMEGLDRHECGAKYWEQDHCHSCGAHITLGDKPVLDWMQSMLDEVPC